MASKKPFDKRDLYKEIDVIEAGLAELATESDTSLHKLMHASWVELKPIIVAHITTDPPPAVNPELAQDVVNMIGEGVHTALRKAVNSRQSGVAWRAIRDLPGREWHVCCAMAGAQVLRILADDKVLQLDAKTLKVLHKWDGCGEP